MSDKTPSLASLSALDRIALLASRSTIPTQAQVPDLASTDRGQAKAAQDQCSLACPVSMPGIERAPPPAKVNVYIPNASGGRCAYIPAMSNEDAWLKAIALQQQPDKVLHPKVPDMQAGRSNAWKVHQAVMQQQAHAMLARQKLGKVDVGVPKTTDTQEPDSQPAENPAMAPPGPHAVPADYTASLFPPHLPPETDEHWCRLSVQAQKRDLAAAAHTLDTDSLPTKQMPDGTSKEVATAPPFPSLWPAYHPFSTPGIDQQPPSQPASLDKFTPRLRQQQQWRQQEQDIDLLECEQAPPPPAQPPLAEMQRLEKAWNLQEALLQQEMQRMNTGSPYITSRPPPPGMGVDPRRMPTAPANSSNSGEPGSGVAAGSLFSALYPPARPDQLHDPAVASRLADAAAPPPDADRQWGDLRKLVQGESDNAVKGKWQANSATPLPAWTRGVQRMERPAPADPADPPPPPPWPQTSGAPSVSRPTWGSLSQVDSASLLHSRSSSYAPRVVPLPTSSQPRPAGNVQAGMLYKTMLQSANKDAKTADLLFLIDATASMTSMIQAVKDRVLEIVTEVESAPPPLEGWKLRLGMIAYRDFGIAPHFEIQDFTSSTAEFCLALGKLKVFSTCALPERIDGPEDVFGGIEMATMFSWESASRTLIHIGDAPAHGREFHDGGAGCDNYIDGDPLKRDMKEIFLNLKMDCQVSLYMFMHVQRLSTTKMLQQFKKISGLNELGDPWLQETDLGKTGRELVTSIVSSVQTSIRHTSTCMSSGPVPGPRATGPVVGADL